MLEISRDYFAPEFAQFRRTAKTIDEYIAEYDLRQRQAGSKMDVGAGIPEHPVSILRVQNAGLFRQEKSLVLSNS